MKNRVFTRYFPLLKTIFQRILSSIIAVNLFVQDDKEEECMNARTVIRIEIREHEGTYLATTDQLPGFLLRSSDMAALDADILPAVKFLLAVKERHQEKKAASKKRSTKPAQHEMVAIRELAFA